MRRPALVLLLAAAVTAPHAQAAPRAVVLDKAGDALLATKSTGDAALPDAPSTPANQAYADVLSAELTALRKNGRFTGFTATFHLAAPPTPPPGVVVTYRIYGEVRGADGAQITIIHNSGPGMDPTGSPSHTYFRDTLTRVTRRQYLPEAKVRGNDLVVTVPADKLPSGLGIGDVFDALNVDIRLCEGLQGQRVPDQAPLGYGGSSGFAMTAIDDAYSTASFVLK